MKIKVRPEDFVVEEVAEVPPAEGGDYCLYRLTKRGANTLDVLRDVARRMGVGLGQVGYGGLKDRHALTTQYITVKGGRPADLEGRNYTLQYLGRSPFPMERGRVKGNKFRIVVRDLGPGEARRGLREAEAVGLYGLPNYFDDQRFGSARHGKGFVAHELIMGNYEEALRLLIATPSRWDEARVKGFRRLLAEHWGNWEGLFDHAPSGWQRQLLEFLSRRRPSRSTFKKALSFVPREEMVMLMNAYQAFIWNETLKEVLRRMGVETYGVPYLAGKHRFWRALSPEVAEVLKALEIPLPSPRLQPLPPWGEAMEAVLQREGIETLASFRTSVKGGVFKASRRRAYLMPEDLEALLLEDDLYPGRRAVELKFFLPSGSYATLLVKRLFSPGRSPRRA